MADNPLKGLVPARYVGDNLLQLPGRYYNPDGSIRTSNIISHGDILMLPEQEILGQTILFDPKAVRDPLYLGTGHRVLPEHQGLDKRTLTLLGYEHHEGRSDFELVQDAPAPAEKAPSEPAPEAPQETPTPEPAKQVVIPDSAIQNDPLVVLANTIGGQQ
jgi:hypothetical protein